MLKPTPLNRELFAHTLRALAMRVFAFVLVGSVLPLLFAVFWPHFATAATNNTLNFQARLETSTGAIVPDGTYNVQFKLYDAATGGSLLWTETRDYNGGSPDNRVRVADGYLTVNLGSVTAFPGTINWDQQLYLTMNIGGTGTTDSWDGEMNPRLALTAVPYAFQAQSAGELQQAQASYTGNLSFATLTGGNQNFVLPDQGGAGTYNLLTEAAGNSRYIQNSTSLQTGANFYIQAADSGTDGTVGSIIRGAAGGQTADLLELQSSGGTILSRFDASGNLYVGNQQGSPVLEVRGASGSSGTLRLGGGGNYATISGNGGGSLTLSAGGNASYPGITISGQRSNVLITGVDSGHVDFTVKASSGKSVDMFELQNSSGNPMTSFNANGDLLIGGANSAASATALQVQNSGGTAVLGVNTSTNTVTVGGTLQGNTLIAGNTAGGCGGSTNSFLATTGFASCTVSGNIGIKLGATVNGGVLNIDAFQDAANRVFHIQGSAGTDLVTIDENGYLTATTALQAPVLDTATAAALNIGTTNATGINLNQNTTVAAGKTLTVNGSGFDSGGNLGIGTTAPGANLDIQSTATTGSAVNIEANSLTNGKGLEVSSTSNTSGATLVEVSQNSTYTNAVGYSSNLINAARVSNVNVPGAGITLDSTTQAQTTSTVASYTYSHTVGSGSNGILLVTVDPWGGSATSVTYNGIALTQAVLATNGAYLQSGIWILKNPPAGTASIVISINAGGSGNYGVYTTASSFFNVDQAASITSNTSSGTSSSTNITISATQPQWVVDSVIQNGAGLTPSSGQTILFNNTRYGTSYKIASGASTSFSWTQGGTDWAEAAVVLTPAATAPVTLSGAVANFSSNCTVVSGSCADDSSILNLNQQYASASGTVLNIQNAGTGNMLDLVNGSGTVVASFDASGKLTVPNVNSTGGYSYNGTAGSTATCASGDYLDGMVIQGGIVTGGTCTAVPTGGGGGGITTIGALDTSGYDTSANGATINGATIYLQSATGSVPGLVNTTTQTFAGAKTFSGQLTASGGLTATGTVNINTSGSGATTIGNSSSMTTINGPFTVVDPGGGAGPHFNIGNKVKPYCTSFACGVGLYSDSSKSIILDTGQFDNNININGPTVVNSGDNETSLRVQGGVASATIPTAVIQGGATPGAGADLLQFQNSGSAVLGGFNSAGQLYYRSGSYTSVIATAALTASQTITLPNATGTVCLQSSASCGFQVAGSYETTTGTDFIRNQTSQQASANFNISGTGMANILQATTAFDTPSGTTTLNIGRASGGVATAINLNVGTTITAGDLSVSTGGIYVSSTQSSAGVNSDYFDTDYTGHTLHIGNVAAGSISLDQSTTVAQGKNLTVGTKALYVNTTNNQVGIGTTSPDAQLNVQSNSTSTVTQAITGAVGQTADLLQFQDAFGTVMGKVDATGQLSLYGGTTSFLGVAAPSGVTATLASGGSLTVGQIYYYVVTSVSESGQGTVASNVVSATPTSGNQTVKISWNSVPGAYGYHIYRSTTSTFTSGNLLIGSMLGNGTPITMTDNGISPGIGNPPTATTGATTVAIQGWSSQTADLLQFQNSSGAVLAGVTSVGDLNVASNVDTYTATTLNLGTTAASNVTIGSTIEAGTITLGQSAATNTISIGIGAVASGNTQTVNIGTAALTGSTQNIYIGSTNAGGGITLNQNVTVASGKTLTATSTGSGKAITGNSSSTGSGIYGTNSGTGNAVYGYNTGTGNGVYGMTGGSGSAVYGFANGSGTGVYGSSITGTAGYFINGTVCGGTCSSGSAPVVVMRQLPAYNTGDILQLQGNNSEVFDKYDLNGNYYAYGTNTSMLALATPTIASVTNTGTAGTTTYGYRVSAVNAQGETIASTEVTTTTGNATLSTTNYNTINWNSVPGASTYKIYGRTAGAELYMATVNSSTTSYKDQGAATPSGALPSSPTGTTLTLQGWGGQTGNVMNVQDSGGTSEIVIDSSGRLHAGGVQETSNEAAINTTSLNITNSTGGNGGGNGSGNAALFVQQPNSANGITLKTISNTPTVYTPFDIRTNNNQSLLQGGTNKANLLLRDYAGQAIDLFELQDVNSDVLTKFDANGQLSTYGTNTNLLALATPAFGINTSATTGGTLTTPNTYYYVITATNAQGETVASTSASFTPTTTTSTYTLNWAQVPGATGYKVYRNTSNSFTSGSLLLTTITNGTTITYTDTGTATTAGLPPTAPTGTTLTLQGWEGQTGYLLQFQNSGGTPVAAINVSGDFSGRLITGTTLTGTTAVNSPSFDTNFSGSLSIGTTRATSITIGSTSLTGTLTLGQSSANNTINIGSANLSGSNVQTINIGAPSGGSGYENIKIGKADTASVVSINGGFVTLTGNNGVSLNVNGSGGGGAVVKSVNNTATAFQIQNSNGGSGVLLAADTSNMRISIGSIGTPTGQLYVSGAVPAAAVGTATFTNSRTGHFLYVQGKYVYTADYASGNNGIEVYDATNPAGPALVNGPSGMSLTYGVTDGMVQGHYLYAVGGSGANGFHVIDISNPAAPVDLVQLNVSSNGLESVYVQGKYAYIDDSAGTLYIYDISNPAAPKLAGSLAGAGLGITTMKNFGLYVQGKYAYLASYSPAQLFVIDISNPASPVWKNTATTALGNDANQIVVSGRYAYVAESYSAKLQILDVSNPVTPVNVASASGIAGNALSVAVQGNRAYVLDDASNLYAIDITNPAGPVNLGSVTTAASPSQVVVSGRYAYVSAASLQIFDLGGAYVQQLQAGGSEVGTLQVDNSANVAGDASIQGGLNVGQSLQVGGGMGLNGSLVLQSSNAAAIATTIQAASGQIADLLQFSSGGGVLSGFDKVGNLFVMSNGNRVTITTSGTQTTPVTLTIPAVTGNDTFCLKNLANCGSAAGVTTITLTPEFAGAVFHIDPASANGHTGTMTTDRIDGLTSTQGYKHNYYAWNTDQTTAQDYDIVAEYQLPSNFTSFATGSWKAWVYADVTTGGPAVNYTIKDAQGDTCASGSLALSAGVWQQSAMSDPSTTAPCSFTKNDIITIDFKLTAIQPSTNYVKLGEVQFGYQ